MNPVGEAKVRVSIWRDLRAKQGQGTPERPARYVPDTPTAERKRILEEFRQVQESRPLSPPNGRRIGV